MSRSFACIILLSLGSFLAMAQVSSKLSGQIIGTKNYYDYTSFSCITPTVLPNTAFDGILTNSYGTCETTGGWVGYDLGEPHIITKLAYCPRTDQPGRMLLGLFEGANNPDFGDALPLYLIQSTPSVGVLTSQTINCSKGFRYLRYKGPEASKCNVAELEFYGYKAIGTLDVLPKPTNLASVVIHTTNAVDITSKDYYLKGIISVINEGGNAVYTDSLEIKGRGNASWNFPKKPYRIKLYNKASLLGLPAKEKNWTLINNYGDKTLMRNLIAFDISKKVGLSYTPAGKPVDVFLNGEYKGTYQLCDQIEVAAERVVVDKMKTTDINLPELSGGYLVEVDAYAYTELSWFSSAMHSVPVTIKYPKDDEIVAQQSAYIKSHFEAMETALFSANYTDNTTGFRKYIDVETFLKHFLVGELSGNTDTYWSTYMYKKRNDTKFYFGPVWDFDIAFENDYRTFPINTNPDWVYASKGSAATGMKNIVNRLFSDPSVLSQLKSTYAQLRNSGAISSQSLSLLIDDYASKLNQSQNLNFMRWNIMNSYVHMNPQVLGSFAAEVNNVKSFLNARILWMDNKLSYVPSATNASEQSTITFKVKNRVVRVDGLPESVDVQAVDMLGRTVYHCNAANSSSFSLPVGHYILSVFSNAACIYRTKCMVR